MMIERVHFKWLSVNILCKLSVCFDSSAYVFSSSFFWRFCLSIYVCIICATTLLFLMRKIIIIEMEQWQWRRRRQHRENGSWCVYIHFIFTTSPLETHIPCTYYVHTLIQCFAAAKILFLCRSNETHSLCSSNRFQVQSLGIWCDRCWTANKLIFWLVFGWWLCDICYHHFGRREWVNSW